MLQQTLYEMKNVSTSFVKVHSKGEIKVNYVHICTTGTGGCVMVNTAHLFRLVYA